MVVAEPRKAPHESLSILLSNIDAVWSSIYTYLLVLVCIGSICMLYNVYLCILYICIHQHQRPEHQCIMKWTIVTLLVWEKLELNR